MEQNFSELMRKYKEELMRYDRIQRSSLVSATQPQADELEVMERMKAETPPARPVPPIAKILPETPPLTESARETIPSELQPQGNPEQNIIPPANLPAEPAPMSGVADSDTGYMIVQLSAAQEALPVAGADIIITRSIGDGAYLMWHAVTDMDGKTRRIALPAPDRAMSEHPGGGVPYAVYNIRAVAPGFYTVTNYDTQVFGGQTSIAAINMIPKRETEMNTDEEIGFTTPPNPLINS